MYENNEENNLRRIRLTGNGNNIGTDTRKDAVVQRTSTMGDQGQDIVYVRHPAKRLLAYLSLWIYRR